MKRLLDDYKWDETLRYEGHRLFYLPADGEEMMMGGIMGAAILCALLVDTDEGDARGIAIDRAEQRNEFFERYEREVRRENGGLFNTEVDALSQAYLELTDSENVLMRICRNDRLFDLAVGLMMDYMQRLVREQVYDHIYEAVPWRMPFAQWLLDAGYVETRRQQLLAIDWLDAAQVYALAEELKTTNANANADTPTFCFEGESAEHILDSYFYWLWKQVQAEAAMLPDAKEQLAQLKPYVLKQETDWDFIQQEIKHLAPEHINMFRRWMREWTDFITRKMSDEPQASFPAKTAKHRFEQELFPDNILSCPPKNNYVAVCDYIEERCRYDEPFYTYYKSHTRVRLCEQLTAMFGWMVEPNHLGKRIKNRKIVRK